MNKSIKSATVFNIVLPRNTHEIHELLSQYAFQECDAYSLESSGFIPVLGDNGSYAENFAGGLAFRFRLDRKVVPDAAINKLANQLIEEAGITGKLSKKKMSAFRDDAVNTLCPIALAGTQADILCFYNFEHSLLFVGSTSQKVVDKCTGKLVKAIGSIEAKTIYIAASKYGLTALFRQWVDSDDNDSFGGELYPVDYVVLTNEKKEKLTFNIQNLDKASSGIKEALGNGFEVDSIGLCASGMKLKVSHDFKLKGISFNESESLDDDDWHSDVSWEIDRITAFVNEIKKLVSYKALECFREEI